MHGSAPLPPTAMKTPLEPGESKLVDNFGRRFGYLRLSLTDVCNFSCQYCLPDGYQKPCAKPNELSAQEITRAVAAFAGLGVRKIRLTGGEPTLRRDFLEIATVVRQVSGIETLAMTTNGYRLVERAADYVSAGVNAINISIDTLDTARFAALTKHDRLTELVAGVDAASKAGFTSVKVNAVRLQGVNDDGLEQFCEFVRDRNVSVRFIELMRTNDNVAFFTRHHASLKPWVEQLRTQGWREMPRALNSGPATEFMHPEYAGRIGFIMPYADSFCESCNRLRLSAVGKLHLCLFGEQGYDLRPWLGEGMSAQDLQAQIASFMPHKKISHDLLMGNSGATPHLASIGG